MTGDSVELAARLAGVLASNLASDIEQCKTREEHIRVTARANAARELALILDGCLAPVSGSTD